MRENKRTTEGTSFVLFQKLSLHCNASLPMIYRQASPRVMDVKRVRPVVSHGAFISVLESSICYIET